MCCKSSTLLIEKAKITPLTFKEIVKLKMHLAMCPPCSNYSKLSKQLDDLFDASNIKTHDEYSLSEEKKLAILEALKGFEE